MTELILVMAPFLIFAVAFLIILALMKASEWIALAMLMMKTQQQALAAMPEIAKHLDRLATATENEVKNRVKLNFDTEDKLKKRREREINFLMFEKEGHGVMRAPDGKEVKKDICT